MVKRKGVTVHDGLSGLAASSPRNQQARRSRYAAQKWRATSWTVARG